jgi:hypothetical protein
MEDGGVLTTTSGQVTVANWQPLSFVTHEAVCPSQSAAQFTDLVASGHCWLSLLTHAPESQ